MSGVVVSSCEGRTSSIARAAHWLPRGRSGARLSLQPGPLRCANRQMWGPRDIILFRFGYHLDSTDTHGRSGAVRWRGPCRVRCSGVRSRRDTRRTTRARRGRVRGWRPPWALCDHSTRTLITVCTGPRPRTAMARPRICRHCAHPHPCHHHSDRDAHNSELRGHAATAITRAQSHRSP